MATYDWKIMKDRRDAATLFLEKTRDDKTFRAKVIANPAFAREAFQMVGQIECPPEVQFACVEPGLPAQDSLVVMILPEVNVGQPQAPIDPLDHWVATWMPYDRNSNKSGSPFKINSLIQKLLQLIKREP